MYTTSVALSRRRFFLAWKVKWYFFCVKNRERLSGMFMGEEIATCVPLSKQVILSRKITYFDDQNNLFSWAKQVKLTSKTS